MLLSQVRTFTSDISSGQEDISMPSWSLKTLALPLANFCGSNWEPSGQLLGLKTFCDSQSGNDETMVKCGLTSSLLRNVLLTSLRRSRAVDCAWSVVLSSAIAVVEGSGSSSPANAQGNTAWMYDLNCSGFPRTEKLVQEGRTGKIPSALRPLSAGPFAWLVWEEMGFITL